MGVKYGQGVLCVSWSSSSEGRASGRRSPRTGCALLFVVRPIFLRRPRLFRPYPQASDRTTLLHAALAGAALGFGVSSLTVVTPCVNCLGKRVLSFDTGSLKLSIGTLSGLPVNAYSRVTHHSEILPTHEFFSACRKKAEGTALSDAGGNQITDQVTLTRFRLLKGVLVECLSTLNPDEDSSDSEVEVFRSPRKTRTEAVCRAEPRYNLASLNLKFKGDTCVRAFVTRLDELRQAREIPERIIFNGFLMFWMDRLLFWLTVPLAEAERLDILLRNVRPEYSRELALIDVTSIEMLKSLCKRLELAGSRAGYTVAPDVQVQSRNNTACRKQAVGSVDKTEGTYCFRCKQAGHKTNRCQRSRELVCFGCGHPGVRTPECPRCTK
ncbi:hypothetical protein MSG28_000756, partial [Choristoneura fumiferana]